LGCSNVVDLPVPEIINTTPFFMKPLHTFTALVLLAGLLGTACSAGKSAVPAFSQKPADFNPDDYVDSSLPEIKNSEEYSIPDTTPAVFAAMRNFSYPEQARIHNMGGRVVLKVYLDETGSIQYIENLNPVGFGMDEEAIRAVSKAKFKPGLYRGEEVKMAVIVPIIFRLGILPSN
jgi:TonB family protein